MKMKKFINAPETITDEELMGLGLAHPGILLSLIHIWTEALTSFPQIQPEAPAWHC